MTRFLTVRHESWPLARPFAISRGVKTSAEVLVVEIADGGSVGRGECVPYARYGESVESARAAVAAIAEAISGGMDREGLQFAMPAGAARNAVDCALWDLDAKRAGTTVAAMLGDSTSSPVVTAETISIGTPDEMGTRASELASAPLLKIKLDAEDVEKRLDAVRAGAPGARLIVDPNEGWDVDFLAEKLHYLADIGVEMIEQPVPVGRDGGLAALDTPIPICADEACHGIDDLAGLRGRYGMVNIKLDKSGGLTEALRMRARAEELGFKIMVGCMVATSLAMAPAVLLAQGAAVVDLDGALLLAQDRADGLLYRDGLLYPPTPALWG